MDATPFLSLISGAIGGATSAGVFKGPIQTLEDWWYIMFGYSASEKAAMLREKQSQNIQSYRDEILQEASKIKSANIQEPSLNILGPSLEASKFYIDEEEIRKMFAKLISSSMDKSKNNSIHSSYVEIIKQLTPLDARNLMAIKKQGNNDLIATYLFNIESGGFVERFQNTYLGNSEEQRQKIIAPSINNLERLGLVSIRYESSRTDTTLYDVFLQTNEYRQLRREMAIYNQKSKEMKLSLPEEEADKIEIIKDIEIKKGIISVTPYGENFCSICL